MVEAADGLNLTEREGIAGIGVFEIEVVGAPGLGVAVVVVLEGEGEEGIGLVVHEVSADLIGAVGETGGVLVGGGLQKDDGGVDGTGAEGEEVRGVDGGGGLAGVLDLDGVDRGSGGVGEQAKDAGVGHQRDVGEMHDLADAVDVGVGLGVDEAGIAVAGVAADALGLVGIGFVAFEAERDGEGVDAEFADVGLDGLHARLIREGGVRVLGGVEGLSGIEGGAEAAGDGGRGAEIAVDVEEGFGLAVVRLEIGVEDGPSGGDAALVVDDAEVFRTHAKHGRAVDLGLATDEVGLLRMEVFAVFILPDFLGVIAVLEEDGGGGLVELFLREKGAALKDQDGFASPREMEGEGAAAGSGTDDDGVVDGGDEGLDAARCCGRDGFAADGRFPVP